MIEEARAGEQRLSAMRQGARRLVRIAGSVVWALAGLAAYTSIVFYMGWRAGVVEGAPVGGPLCEQAEPRR